MRIKMTHQISGTRDGKDWPTPGNEISLPDDEALTLISQGMAKVVAEPEKAEKAEAPKVEETRTAPAKPAPKTPAKRGPGRPRKTGA